MGSSHQSSGGLHIPGYASSQLDLGRAGGSSLSMLEAFPLSQNSLYDEVSDVYLS